MTRPKVLLDPHWRRMAELFSPTVLTDLKDKCDLIWGKDEPMPRDQFTEALRDAEVLVTTAPEISQAVLDGAPDLQLVVEVEGAFPGSIDYAACAARNVEVLSCAPGFRQSVAEMGLAMALAGARGLVAEHDAMRTGQEHWLEDHAGRDFTLFGATVGIVGFGQIAQELARLLKPFGVRLLAHDPWLPASVAAEYNVKLLSLDDVMARARCLFVAAVPTTENRHLLNARNLALMPKGALLVLLSRAHLVDFDALIARVDAGDIRAAVDVFPFEPVSADDPVRTNPGLILSPHRAAAVEGGRQLIGEMIRDDIFAWMTGDPKRRLGVADHKRIAALAGVGDATQTSSMALDRQG